jgi:hypothetical protein
LSLIAKASNLGIALPLSAPKADLDIIDANENNYDVISGFYGLIKFLV